jgi:hypothetical protein
VTKQTYGKRTHRHARTAAWLELMPHAIEGHTP